VSKVISLACDDASTKCTISGEDERRALSIRSRRLDGPAISLADIRFTTGRSPDDLDGGGGLRVYLSRVDIVGCEFSNNVARYESYNAWSGAGFYGRGAQTPPQAPQHKHSH
jgi:hypothetical protein